MFGYAAPQVPRGTAPAQPGQGFAPPQQQGFGQQPGARPGQPPQPGGFGQQPGGYPPPGGQQPGYPPQPGQPPQQANPYGQPQQPPQPGGFGGQPPNPYGQPQQPPNPYAQPQQPGGFGGQPPQQNPYGQPQGGPPGGGFGGQPPQANPYGQPQQPPNPYGQPQPPAGPGYGQPPAGATPGFGQPQQGFGQAPPQYPQGGYPPAGGFGAAPQQDLPGPLDDLARKVPGSAPGTIFGFPVSRLRDPSLQRKVLFIAGVALLVSIVVPINFSPFIMMMSLSSWEGLIWPIIAGGAYLLVAAAPPDIRAKVPPAVLQWIPFGISFAGIFMVSGGGPGAMGSGLYMLGYAVLVFGLLARIAQPQDQIARIVIAVGAAMLVPDFIDILRFAFRFSFHGGAIFTVLHLLTFVVTLIGIACALFVVPPQKLPPALQAVDALGPLFTAVLILFLPLKVVLMGLGTLVHGGGGLFAILIMIHLLIRIVAFFGVLMLVAPAAYEEVMRMVKGGGAGGGGGQQQQSGGYPPPQGGGYPPQGGGYPPQGGGYPPQGGGYPPQQGGGGGWQ